MVFPPSIQDIIQLYDGVESASYSNLTPKIAVCRLHLLFFFSLSVCSMLSTWYISYISLMFSPNFCWFFRSDLKHAANSIRNPSKIRPFILNLGRLVVCAHCKLLIKGKTVDIFSCMSEGVTVEFHFWSLFHLSRIYPLHKQFNFCGQMLIVTNKNRSTTVNSIRQFSTGREKWFTNQ